MFQRNCFNVLGLFFFSEVRQDPLPIRLLHVKPRLPKNAPKSAELKLAVVAEIALDPSCTYKIR